MSMHIETSEYRKIVERPGLRPEQPNPGELTSLPQTLLLPRDKNPTPAIGLSGLRQQNSLDPLAFFHKSHAVYYSR